MSDPVPPRTAPAESPTPVPATAPWVTPVTLTGSRMRMEPLALSHLPGPAAAAGANPATWTWMHAPLADEASMRTWVEEAPRNRNAGAEVPFATVDAATTRVLAGIGATFEGILGRHQLMAGGRVRDSAWYAITDQDWPAVRERLRARLAGQAAAAQRAAAAQTGPTQQKDEAR